MSILLVDGIPGLGPESDTYRIGSLVVPKSVTKEDPYQWVLRVQPFDSGGFEAYVHRVDLSKLHRFADELAPPRTSRVAPVVVNEESRLRSVGRARREVRLIARNLGVDRLVTLTTRESENTPEALYGRFAKLKRAYRAETGEDFHYVSVHEPHPSNPKHFHLHLGVHGFVHLEVMRRLWWEVCGGRGMGNVDVQKQRGQADASRIARYIAKYIAKDLSDRFNKKRYSASRKTLPESLRMVLADVQNDAVSAFTRLCSVMGLTNGAVMSAIAKSDSVWFRPDGLGVWVDWRPELGPLDAAPF